MLPQWHEDLPPAPLRTGYRGTAGLSFRRTNMEAGQSRSRLAPGFRVTVDCGWRMSAAGFERFKSFYRADLAEGTRWFRLPLWFGGPVQTVPAQFASRYAASPRAAHAVTVTAQLHLRALPYQALSLEARAGFTDEAGCAIWPAALPAAPLRTGLTLDPHRDVLATDLDGPRAKRDLFGPSAASLPVSWSMDEAQFELFKGFWFEGLARGNKWFAAPLWFGSSLETALTRLTGPFSFEPHGAARVLVSGAVEVRRLPIFLPPVLRHVLPSSLAGGSRPGADIEIEIWSE